MPELTPVLIVVALIVLVLIGMALGWRASKRRSVQYGEVAQLPDDPGQDLLTADVFYVSTTLEAQALQRVASRGLAVRGRATVQVFWSGVSLALPGQDAVFIPTTSITGLGTGTVTVDRVVEPGGMIVITWILGSTPVDTYLRPLSGDDKTRILDTIHAIRPGSVASSRFDEDSHASSNEESEL
ncbi:PH-like domain-containing protein [Naasia lichenicola]|uniref:PH domain-containing protein n=1 Tax=Naasia lichenicola TaxID=2565933 RepID=A0A4S4FRQ4_9MICO|nr:hypothetical protein [Naasia lichenicola]THG33054.1 hypothetical protein E6C64_01440 [Naasia lichenicola]